MGAKRSEPQNGLREAFLEPGTMLNLEITDADSPIKGVFIGERSNEYLAFTPLTPLDPLKGGWPKHKPFSVRYLFQGQLHEFQTRFIEYVKEPVDIVLLEIPEKIEKLELRAHKRVTCFIAADIEIETEKGGLVTGIIKDISKSGCCFCCGAPYEENELFDLNEQVTLKCQFPGIAGEQEALGKVTDVRQTDDGTAVSIQFSDVLSWVPPYE
jgi:hypothetical protein